MQTVTLCYGLPASGKSTWAKDQVKNSNGKIVRVNMDDIRAMVGLPYSKDAEDLALKIQDKSILAAIAAGKDVIVDNTHIEKKMPERIKKLFDGDVLFKVQDFTHISSHECARRDFERENPVGAMVISRMANRLGTGKWKLTEEWMNDYAFPLVPLEYDPALPWVIVFDTDGTTALHNRSPYDYARAYTDTPDDHMCSVLRVLRDDYTMTFMGMSGRPDTWRELTEEWYANIAQVPYDEFYMRVEGDSRNDADVKHEMVEKYIRGKYNVLMWFDDRDRVVRRLRKLGIKVAQVAYGDF